MLSNSPQPLNYPHLLSPYSLPSPLLSPYAPSLRAKHNSLRPSAAVFHCCQSSTSTPVMPAEELAQGLVVSFFSAMSHRAAIFHVFLYAFISVVCYGSNSTRARAGDDHAAGPLASAMQPTGVVAGRHTTVTNHRSVRARQTNGSQSVVCSRRVDEQANKCMMLPREIQYI